MIQNEEFDLDLEKNIKVIREVLFTKDKDAIAKIKKSFYHYQTNYSPLLKKEYLAHIISIMEKIVRKLGNEVFVIELNEIQIDDEQYSRVLDIFSSETDDDLSAFIINYPKVDDSTLLSIGIAQELGHLFDEILKRHPDSNTNRVEKSQIEEFCSLFALIVISDRSNFYKYVSSQHTPSLTQILNKISFLHAN